MDKVGEIAMLRATYSMNISYYIFVRVSREINTWYIAGRTQTHEYIDYSSI